MEQEFFNGMEDEIYNSKEDEWSKGCHTSSSGEKFYLRHMSKKHLERTINYFKFQADVSDLERELRKRK